MCNNHCLFCGWKGFFGSSRKINLLQYKNKEEEEASLAQPCNAWRTCSYFHEVKSTEFLGTRGIFKATSMEEPKAGITHPQQSRKQTAAPPKNTRPRSCCWSLPFLDQQSSLLETSLDVCQKVYCSNLSILAMNNLLIKHQLWPEEFLNGCTLLLFSTGYFPQ